MPLRAGSERYCRRGTTIAQARGEKQRVPPERGARASRSYSGRAAARRRLQGRAPTSLQRGDLVVHAGRKRGAGEEAPWERVSVNPSTIRKTAASTPHVDGTGNERHAMSMAL